tara:strand:+ start:332 stop:1933 length:1602 start_codon:yes stop_codon:yes gene_type:complete
MFKIFVTCFAIIFPFLSFGQSFNGFALYNAQGSSTTYLIDENQNIAHTWTMPTECNYTVQLKDNGNIVRGTKNNTQTGGTNNSLGGAADAGRVQEIDPLGNVVMDFIYSSSSVLSHHDLTLIGDNILLTAWEVKTSLEINNAGGSVTSDKWPTHFVEIASDGNGGGQIVWEWHIWDHMIQDVDSNLPNYGVVSENPHLIDINMITAGGGGGPGGSSSGDWFHVNGVDYNEDLDQISFSSRFASEIYIIDHSTTTAEAASHTGGNSGMGGDILYRWGNPSNYNTSGSQIIPNAVHDVRWITNDGRPNGGFLQVFNNSGVSNNQSAVDGIETPIDPSNPYNYYRNPGQAFGPSSYSTRYECAYSASGQSASDRMYNGNIFVNASGGQGGAGVMYEVDQNGSIVWGPYNADTQKAFRYECEHPGVISLEPYMNSTASTSCFTASVQILETDNDFLSLYPNPTSDILNVSFNNSFENDFDIIISNSLGQEIYYKSYKNMNHVTHQKINLLNQPKGYYNLSLISKDGNFYSYKIALIK